MGEHFPNDRQLSCTCKSRKGVCCATCTRELSLSLLLSLSVSGFGSGIELKPVLGVGDWPGWTVVYQKMALEERAWSMKTNADQEDSRSCGGGEAESAKERQPWWAI